VQLLMKLTVKPTTWTGLRQMAHEWASRGQALPADVIGPFNRTKDNRLSVYELNDEGTNSARVLAAIGVGSQSGLTDTDCLIFDSTVVDGLGIALEKSEGTTLDTATNKLHWDLVTLTGTQIVALASALVDGAKVEPMLQSELVTGLKEAVASGQVDVAKLSVKVRQQSQL
jgi:hypothetical protein